MTQLIIEQKTNIRKWKSGAPEQETAKFFFNKTTTLKGKRKVIRVGYANEYRVPENYTRR